MESTIKKLSSARRIFFLSFVLIFLLSGFAPISQDPEPSILDNILRIVASFASLAGVSAAVGMFIALLRALNVVKTDEQAGKATASLNLLAFGVLCYFGVFRPDLSLDWLDATAAKIASIGLFVLGFILQMYTPAPVLRAMYQARVPLLGVVGERVEARAHYVKPSEPGQNWTTDLEDLRKKQ